MLCFLAHLTQDNTRYCTSSFFKYMQVQGILRRLGGLSAVMGRHDKMHLRYLTAKTINIVKMLCNTVLYINIAVLYINILVLYIYWDNKVQLDKKVFKFFRENPSLSTATATTRTSLLQRWAEHAETQQKINLSLIKKREGKHLFNTTVDILYSYCTVYSIIILTMYLQGS